MKQMKKISFVLVTLLLLAGCKSKSYRLAYEGIDKIKELNYGRELQIEECFYVKDDVVDIDSHVVYNFTFINKYEQRIHRYFLYMNKNAYDENINAKEYYNLAIESNYYIKLDIEKINKYLNK